MLIKSNCYRFRNSESGMGQWVLLHLGRAESKMPAMHSIRCTPASIIAMFPKAYIYSDANCSIFDCLHSM